MLRNYDLAVIGSGTAARTAAFRVRAGGRSVAIVDHRPFGGTCALRGCDPKKILVSGAEAVDHARRMADKGVAGNAHIVWSDLMRFKRGFTDPIPAEQEQSYREHGIDAYRGVARFLGPDRLDLGGDTVVFRNALLAVGAAPVSLGIPGEEHLATSETFLALEALPRRIVLVGGGYIAAELSHVASRAGAEVVILQRAPRLLPRFDPDLVAQLMQRFDALGIETHLDTEVEAVERDGDSYSVRAKSADGVRSFEADLVVHAAGRAPALEALDLEAGNVAHENGRLTLNEFLQSTSNPAVFAAGDAAQRGPPLTPVSTHDAQVAAHNILEGPTRRPNYFGVPSVAFTIPPIAAVGLGEREASDLGHRFRMQCRRVGSWFTARAAAEPIYGFKVLVEEGSERILGAHLVGPHAEEVINIFALAIRHGLTAADLRSTMFAYPTSASDVGEML